MEKESEIVEQEISQPTQDEGEKLITVVGFRCHIKVTLRLNYYDSELMDLMDFY